jgi:hypothetical protein
MRSCWITSILAAVGLLASGGQTLAQEFPDEATQLKQQLAMFAVPYLADEDAGADAQELVAAVVCVVEALNPLPDDVKSAMLTQDDFEDALDLAVEYAEEAGFGDRGIDLEKNLEACF